MERLVLTTEIENADFYIASLAIGILEGIKSESLSLETGIWSLARPIFWAHLNSNLISAELIKLVSSLDEIDALQSLGGDSLKKIDEYLVFLKIIQREAFLKKTSLAITSLIEVAS